MRPEHNDLAAQDEIEYADNATVLIEKDTRGKMRGRVGNYDIVTETRELKIH